MSSIRRYIFRVPKKWVLFTLLGIVLVDLVLLSYFQIISRVVELNQAVDKFVSPTDFHRKVLPLFDKIKKEKDRFWITNSELTHVQCQVPILEAFAFNDTEGSDTVYFDPRYTVAVYMHELAEAGQTDELPELPFHWVDWVNVSLVNTKLGLDLSKRTTCQRLKNRIRGRPNPDTFCRNKEDIPAEELEEAGFRNVEQLPEAIIHNHCSHKNPSFNNIRAFMARSYIMTNLPKPYKVIILNDSSGGGTYEFMVNQTRSADQRLLYSEIARKFLRSNNHNIVNDTLTINHLDVYKHLQATVKPRMIEPKDDIMGMHKIVKSPIGHTKDIELKQQNFNYPRSRIAEQIKEYEAKENRTIFDDNFLAGLKECAAYNGTNEPMYFKMALLDTRERRNVMNDAGWHYDWRFFSDALFYDKMGWSKDERVARTNIILERLLRNWNIFAEQKGIVSWIMHGPLLAWYWDGLMFPYDVDIDIQMPILELVRMSLDYNQTLVVENPAEGYGKFLIDVGSYIHNREQSLTGNHIDARFVDVDSGIYIDITGLAKLNFNLPGDYKKNPIVVKAKGDADAEVYNDRRKHFYTFPQLLPLHYSMMSGVPLYVPNEIEERLRWEYSGGLDKYEFQGWYFVPKLQLWVMYQKISRLFDEKDVKNEDGDLDIDKMVDKVKSMTDSQALQLLEDDEILAEYYQTATFSGWHTQERQILFDAEGRDNRSAFEDPNTRNIYNHLVGKVSFTKPLRKCLYEFEAFDRIAHHKKRG